MCRCIESEHGRSCDTKHIVANQRGCHVFVLVEKSRDPVTQLGEMLDSYTALLHILKRCGVFLLHSREVI